MRASGTCFPLLGTDVEVTVEAESEAVAYATVDRVLDEMEAWHARLTAFDESSELRRWREGRLDDPGPELVGVLALAQEWYARSGGTFHPALGALSRLWADAATSGVEPTRETLAAHVPGQLPFYVSNGVAVRVGDCTGVDLNAVAKGAAVDAGVRVAANVDGVAWVLVDAGGDLRRAGREGSLTVDVADPREAPGGSPLLSLELGEGAVATSAADRGGFRSGQQHPGVVLDPRTGRPAEVGTLQATVLATDAATADVLATACLVLPAADAVDLLRREGARGVLVLPGGVVRV